MAKKRGRSRRARARARKAAANPIIRGQQAFHQGDYDGAIAAWEQARKGNPSASLTSALAEVYFRRGLARFYRRQQHKAGLSDLNQATRLVPGDPRYAYHLGLAHHRQGNRSKALSAYRLALDADPSFSRASELTILARLEQGQNPTQSAAWKALPSSRQAELKPLVGLVRGQPVDPGASSPSAGLARLWQGLAALQSGDHDARNMLQSIAQDNKQPAAVRAVSAYALGLAALQHGPSAGSEQARLQEAQAHWEAARRLGLDTPAFRDNLGLLYRIRAERMMADGQAVEAAVLADAALDLLPSDRDLKDLTAAAHFQAGYVHAQASRWGKALEHWEKARELGEDSRALVQNLALAYEKTERFREAADLWRQVVRRRPRKANAPDALTPQQVALLWGHVAECYRQAGAVEEAITTLRNAVKNDPDNTDLRLELTDALAASERWDAASNELGRILDRNPDSVGALVRAARIDEEDGYLARAQQIWKKILKLDSNHLEARERLAELLWQEGDRYTRFGDFGQALESYWQALEYTPDEPSLYLSLAQCYFRQDDPDAAHRELEDAFALDSTDLDTYHSAVDMCHIAGRAQDAEWVITRAEQLAGPNWPTGHLPVSFYLGIARCCFNRHQTKQGNDYVRRAEQLAEGDPDALVDVGTFYLDRDDEGRAVTFFERALRLNPEHGWANYHMGASYAVAAEMREANRHWRQARRTARQTGDQDLLETVEMTRQHFERALDMIERGFSPFEIFAGLGMGMFEDYDDDDDEYW